MNFIIKGRGVELNDRLREYASSKLTKAERFLDRIIEMDVELTEERNPRVRNPHKVEVTVKTPRDTIRASGAGTDYFTAIDQAAERLERQVKKLKGSRLSNRTRSADNQVGSGDVAPSDDGDGPAIVRTIQPAAKPMTPEEAVLELDTLRWQFLLFTNAETMSAAVIYRRTDGAFGLIESGP